MNTFANWWPTSRAGRAFGFLGCHERGCLPRCDFTGLFQVVAFPLADSIPTSSRSGVRYGRCYFGAAGVAGVVSIILPRILVRSSLC